jgi:hypothetical protein
VSLGGPIQRDKTWIFAAYRRAYIDSTVDRSPADVRAFEVFRPDLVDNFPANELHSHQPFVKVTSRVASNHELVGVLQYDRMRQRSVRSNEGERTTRTDVGGGMYGLSLQSTFGQTLTTKFAFNYNSKQGNDLSSYEQRLIDLGVPVTIFQSTTLSQGIPTGVGNIFNEGGYCDGHRELRYSMIPGDVTWFNRRAGGVARVPERLPAHARNPTRAPASSWIQRADAEPERLRDPNNMNSGRSPHARFDSALETSIPKGATVTTGHVQDTWRPNASR